MVHRVEAFDFLKDAVADFPDPVDEEPEEISTKKKRTRKPKDIKEEPVVKKMYVFFSLKV